MSCFVYVLGSIGPGRLLTYVGWTNDLKRRVDQHNAGRGARFTKGRVWVLLHSEPCATRAEAMSREWHLKRDRQFRRQLARQLVERDKAKTGRSTRSAARSPRLNRSARGSRVSDMTASGRGVIRRVVTGHDTKGRAVVKHDDMVQGTKIPHADGYFMVPWTTDRSPADNMDPLDGARREVGLTCPGGTVLRITDLGPGLQSPMHRTKSVDYGIVLEGEIELVLDSGETATLKAGEVIVQRGTIHAWINRSDRWCRIAFILVDAEPVSVNGVPLEPTD